MVLFLSSMPFLLLCCFESNAQSEDRCLCYDSAQDCTLLYPSVSRAKFEDLLCVQRSTYKVKYGTTRTKNPISLFLRLVFSSDDSSLAATVSRIMMYEDILPRLILVIF